MLAKVQAKAEGVIPRGDGWVYEPKWDGFRTVVFRDGDHIDLRSRNDRPLGRYFPEIESMLMEELPERCVLDGEIIMPGPDRLEFDVLQLRLHPAASRVQKLSLETPASFVVFDVIAHGDDDLRDVVLSERLARLSELFGSVCPAVAREPATAPGPRFFLTPRTEDPDLATEWFDDLEKVGLEGIIAKRLGLAYMAGERVMLKIKHRRSADCVVVGYRGGEKGGVASLLLGLYEGDELRYIGHTSGFGAAARREVYDLLQPLRNESALDDQEWGPGGGSRWSGGKDQEWNSVEPTLVCEVSYDFVQSGHRFRHAARFLRWRDDKRPDECTFDQVST